MTIQTADGYSVTLVHLGAIAVTRGQAVVEGDGVGSAGRSGDPEHAESYVHLGVRRTADPNGYDSGSAGGAGARPRGAGARARGAAAPARASRSRTGGSRTGAGAGDDPRVRASSHALDG